MISYDEKIIFMHIIIFYSNNKIKGGFILSIFQKIVLVITIIGAINWGLIGLFAFDLVAFLFGDMSILSRTVYSLVGIAGIINIALLFIKNEDY